MKKRIWTSALLLGFATLAQAQQPAATLQLPKTEVFAGYSYWAPSGSVQGHAYSSIATGFMYGGDYFFDKKVNRHLGIDVEGSYHRTSPCTQCVALLSAGPVVQYREKKFVFTGHALLGGASVSGPDIASTGVGFYQNPSHTGLAFTLGGAVDYPLSRRVAWRVAQTDFEYIHDNFGAPQATTGGIANIKAFQLSTGIVVYWGSRKNP